MTRYIVRNIQLVISPIRTIVLHLNRSSLDILKNEQYIVRNIFQEVPNIKCFTDRLQLPKSVGIGIWKSQLNHKILFLYTIFHIYCIKYSWICFDLTPKICEFKQNIQLIINIINTFIVSIQENILFLEISINSIRKIQIFVSVCTNSREYTQYQLIFRF